MAVVVATLSGCDGGGDEYDHHPPAGMGSLIVDNRTAADIRVFIDGRFAGRAGDWDNTSFDFAPGAYRLVLDEADGRRSYSGDLDILDSRRTIIEVRPGGSLYTFDAFSWVD